MKIAILTSIKMFYDSRASGLRLISVNLFLVLKKMGYEVDFIISNSYEENYYTYNSIHFEKSVINQNFFVKDVKVNIKSPFFPFILPRRRKIKFDYKTKAVDINSYDVVFTSFLEWDKIINHNLKKDIKIFNIYHDNIQEKYRFLKQFSTLKAFNANHIWQKNMLYSNNILCVSEDAIMQFKDCFGKHEYFNEKKLLTIPSNALPLFSEENPKYQKREDALVIGNIFDTRKKPLEAVEIINKMKQIKKLYIYGSPRCKKPLIRQVFNTLRKDIEVEWIMQASTITVIDWFSKSKALLFPSEFEGLGLPIIEAQMRGCPVMVRNKAPMNSLILEGSVLMSKTAEENSKILDNLFIHFNQNEVLKENARQAFNSKNLENTLKELL